jgi:AraC family transcriptional regulator
MEGKGELDHYIGAATTVKTAGDWAFLEVPQAEILWNEQKDITSPTFKSKIWIPVKKKEHP